MVRSVLGLICLAVLLASIGCGGKDTTPKSGGPPPMNPEKDVQQMMDMGKSGKMPTGMPGGSPPGSPGSGYGGPPSDKAPPKDVKGATPTSTEPPKETKSTPSGKGKKVGAPEKK